MKILIFKNIYIFLVVLGLCCCEWTFSGFREQGLLSNCSAQAPHCGGFSHFGVWAFDCAGSVAVGHGLSCSATCGIFLDEGSNTCPLPWQGDSYLTVPPGKSQKILIFNYYKKHKIYHLSYFSCTIP